MTDRNLNRTEAAIQQYGVRHPNFLCGDVGTTIRKFENGEWQDDEGWVDHVKRSSPRWDATAVKRAVAEVQGMREQEGEHQNQFKHSYYVEHENKNEVLQQVDALVKDKFDEVIIYSFDSQDGKGLGSAPKRSLTRIQHSGRWVLELGVAAKVYPGCETRVRTRQKRSVPPASPSHRPHIAAQARVTATREGLGPTFV